MSEEQKDKELELEGHSYDGITELDNPLPNWWLWTFIFTVIFSFLYYIHYEVSGSGPTLKEELAASMQELEKNQNSSDILFETEESLMAVMNDPAVVDIGTLVYANKCAVCHGNELQGQIGPNLTDKYWIHGRGTRLDIVKLVRDGVPDKGMPSWKQLVTTNELYAVAAFILNKKDSHPANAKEPQGAAVEN